MGVRRYFACAAVGALSVLCGPSFAAAGTVTHRDANDVAGRLDVKWARHGHSGGDLVHTIGTWASFSSRALRGANMVAFALDTNRRWADDAEWWAYVYWTDGRLRAELVDSSFTSVTRISVRRPASNRLQVTIPRVTLGGARSYRWFAATVYGSAQDFAPNRGGVLHDLTPPTIRLTATRVVSAAAAAGESFPVEFSVSDTGGAGLASWRLEWRSAGAATWSRLRRGTTGGAKTVAVAGVAGATYEFRVVALDRQRNRRISPVRTVMSGFTATFDGTYVAWISRLGPEWGSGEVVLDGGTPHEVALTAETETLNAVAFEDDGLAPGSHTITIRALTGDIAVDAIASR